MARTSTKPTTRVSVEVPRELANDIKMVAEYHGESLNNYAVLALSWFTEANLRAMAKRHMAKQQAAGDNGERNEPAQ